MNLEKAITESISKLKEEGFIDNLVKKELEKSISSIVNNALSNYSDFGESLRNTIQEKLNVNFDNLDLPEYTTLLNNWVQEIVNKNINLIGKERIEKNIKEFLTPLNKNHWKLSEIITKFKDEVFNADNDKYEQGFYLEIQTDKSLKGYIDVYFDEDNSTKDWFYCDYGFRLKPHKEDGEKLKIWELKIDRKEIYNKPKFKPCLFGFDAFLFQLYCSNTTIENDIENVEDHNYLCGD